MEIDYGKVEEYQKDRADRYNTGKRQWKLMHLPSFDPMVQVLEYGAKKYAPNQWMKGFPITEIYDSLMRHMIAFMGGEDTDPESGLPHIGHIQCNIMFLSYVWQNYPHFDDRVKELENLKVNLSAVSKPSVEEVAKMMSDIYKQDRTRIITKENGNFGVHNINEGPAEGEIF